MEKSGSQHEKPSRKGGRPSRADAQKLHHHILDAAEKIFLSEGFNGGSVDTIAAEAGTSKPTIYARFGSKEKLFIAVSNRLLAPRFDAITANDVPMKEAFYDVADQILAAMLDPKLVRMHQIILAEARRFPELALLSDEDEHFPGRAALLTLLDRTGLCDAMPDAEKRRMMLMLQDMILTTPLRAATLGISKLSPTDLKAHARLAIDIFLCGLTAISPNTPAH